MVGYFAAQADGVLFDGIYLSILNYETCLQLGCSYMVMLQRIGLDLLIAIRVRKAPVITVQINPLLVFTTSD